MKTAMESIRGMVDVHTVVGDAVQTQDGTVIIPISRVSFGFAAGGGEYGFAAGRDGAAPGQEERAWPFAGGSGAGVTVQPLGFLVVGRGEVRLLPVTERALYDRLIDLLAVLVERWTRRGESSALEEDLLEDLELAPRREEG